MNLFDRFSNIMKANIGEMLSKAEDPEKMIKLYIEDAKNQLEAFSSAVGDAISTEKLLQKQYDGLIAEAKHWEDNATIAVKSNRDDLATKALEQQTKIEQRIEKLKGPLSDAHAQTVKMKENMNILKEKISIVADQILRLGEQTVRVGNIADMVKDLASEINMLALNAAVEAARAGEHGKGFAVVASEVRKLAVESKKSAEQTNAIIAEIQKATNSSIMKMEEGTKTTEEVTRLTQNVGELFNSLSSAADRMYENTQQVLLNAKQQSAAIGQVIEAISSINTGAKETAAGITQTKAGIERLDEAAQNLKKVV